MILALALLGVRSACAQAAASEWTLERVFSVGSAPDTTVLQRIRSLQLLRDGRLLIADAGARSIVVVDSSGRPRPPLGRMGSGPAEYRTPYALATLGDTIAVLDPGNGRIGLFRSNGTWAGSWMAQNITGGTDVRLYRVPGAEFFAYGTRRVGSQAVSTFIRHDSRGPRDTLATDPRPSDPEFGVVCQIAGGMSFFSTTLQSHHLRIPGPRGTLLDAEMTAYRIVQRTARGAVVTTFTGPASPVPISDGEWDSVGAELAKFHKEHKDSKCTRESLARPTSKPAIRAMWWDDSGRLWVERYVISGFAFDLFDQRGMQIASLRAPSRNSEVEPSVVGNRIALLGENADGAPVVHVYRFSAKR